ncbi:hypothetical protein ACWFQ8_31650 [Streptomyces sp. NPDC055254]
MATIAVSGHVDITGTSTPLIREALLTLLARYPASELPGISCLAEGADALFADAVLAVGGQLLVVMPSSDYRARMVDPGYAEEFDRLCRAAAEVKVMPYRRAAAPSYAAANRVLLNRAELLVAVWDGLPGRGRGGTADAVAMARAAGLPVEVVWPPGSERWSRPQVPAGR